MLIDTHAHLYLEQFDEDIDEVMKNALDHGVEKIFLPNIDSSTTQALNDLVRAYPDNCFPMIGLHPCSVKANYLDELKHVEEELAKGHYIAVGEVGLDYYWDTYFKKEQINSFKRQIDLAEENDLPVIIHSRDSLDETIRIIGNKQKGNLKGIFHCFNGTVEQAKEIAGSGFLVGLGGVVTYKKADLGEMVASLSDKQIVLETDAPYLSPVPKRGKRNESANIIHIAEHVSEIRGASIEEISRISTENAMNLFSL